MLYLSSYLVHGVTMVKNTGIPENQLSDFDMGSVLKDAHNKALHALDVNSVNGIAAPTSSKIVPTYDSCGNLTQVEYYGLGKKEITDIILRANPQGTFEITTFSLTAQTPAGLDTKYAIIYDEVGSVGIQFRLDGGSLAATGAARDIICDIATGDSTSALATKLASSLNSDSKFSGSALGALSVIQSSTVGIKSDATAGDTTISIAIVDGIDSYLEKLFYVFNNDNSLKYGWYYTIDGSGSEPSNNADVIAAINILSTDDIGQSTAKTITAVNSPVYFNASGGGTTVRVTQTINGNTTGFLDGNTGFSGSTIQDGKALELVQTTVITYDGCNISSVEVIK